MTIINVYGFHIAVNCKSATQKAAYLKLYRTLSLCRLAAMEKETRGIRHPHKAGI